MVRYFSKYAWVHLQTISPSLLFPSNLFLHLSIYFSLLPESHRISVVFFLPLVQFSLIALYPFKSSFIYSFVVLLWTWWSSRKFLHVSLVDCAGVVEVTLEKAHDMCLDAGSGGPLCYSRQCGRGCLYPTRTLLSSRSWNLAYCPTGCKRFWQYTNVPCINVVLLVLG